MENKLILEKTKYLEKELLAKIENGFESLYYYINNINSKSPKIYTSILEDDNNSYDFFLYKMIDYEKFNIYSDFLDNVYIDKTYYDIKKIENEIYMGKFKLEDEEYRFTYTLKRDTRYDDKISALYNSFLESNIKWYGVDKRDINKMYRVKVLSYIDDISLLSDIDFSHINIEYNLSSDFKFNLNIFWNIEEGYSIGKSYLTNLDGVGFKYIIEKEEDVEYLIKDENDLIEDVVSFKDRIEIYSKSDKLYLFNVYKIHKFYKNFLSKYTVNYNSEINDDVNLRYIKKYLEKNGFEVESIEKSKDKKSHLKIPNYNKQITKLYISYINIKIKNIKDYDNLFWHINLLQTQLSLYEIIIYE